MHARRFFTAAVAAAALGALARGATAQEPADATAALLRVAALLRDSGAAFGESIWPGFRPDTTPVAFVVHGRGTWLIGWGSAPLPEGFQPVEGGAFRAETARGAASTAIELDRRILAQVVVDDPRPVALAGVTMHEAFHAFQRMLRRDDRRFGRGENAVYVAQYPVFDAANDAGMALEGRLLHAAIVARDRGTARTLARQFVAVREARHRRLGANVAEYEVMTELNEGLAEYAMVRTHVLLGEPVAEVRAIRELLTLTGNPGRSVRLRFYGTGSGQALLLDRLVGHEWKNALVTDLSLQEALARASGMRDNETALVRAAEREHDMPGLRSAALRDVAALRTARRRQADSLLARPGVTVVLDPSATAGRSIGQCGFDPQNMLVLDSVQVLHTRWLRVCGGGYDGEFNTPVLQDRGAGTLTAVIGPSDSVRVTSSSGTTGDLTDVRIESPGLTIRLARAIVERSGNLVRIRPRN